MRIFKRKIKLSIKKKLWISLSIVLLIIISGLLYLNYVVNPVIIEVSQAKIRSLASKAIGAAVYEVITENVYDNLITISRDLNDNIVMISTNAVQINKLTRELTKTAQIKLETIGDLGIDIPIGTFTGMPIFTGRGPPINIKLVPVGSISSNYVSEFITAGINQTNHRIYVNITSSISIILPTANKTIITETQVMITESIIIGKVPETYLNSNSLDEMLNLIP